MKKVQLSDFKSVLSSKSKSDIAIDIFKKGMLPIAKSFDLDLESDNMATSGSDVGIEYEYYEKVSNGAVRLHLYESTGITLVLENVSVALFKQVLDQVVEPLRAKIGKYKVTKDRSSGSTTYDFGGL
jgi:hypothetical protein